jgi:hypothetical protein
LGELEELVVIPVAMLLGMLAETPEATLLKPPRPLHQRLLRTRQWPPALADRRVDLHARRVERMPHVPRMSEWRIFRSKEYIQRIVERI